MASSVGTEAETDVGKLYCICVITCISRILNCKVAVPIDSADLVLNPRSARMHTTRIDSKRRDC